MTRIKLLHVSAPECHPQAVYWNKEIHAQHGNMFDLHSFVFVDSVDGTSVPKHVEILYL
jgi:hypothetical protein